MSLGNTVLQLFRHYYLWCLYRYFLRWVYCTFTLALSEVCVQCPKWLFSVFPSLPGFPAFSSRIFLMILKWFQLLQLLLVSPLFLPSTCVVFLLSGPYILKSSRLPFLLHFCYPRSQHLQGAAERTPLFGKLINSKPKKIRQFFFLFPEIIQNAVLHQRFLNKTSLKWRP